MLTKIGDLTVNLEECAFRQSDFVDGGKKITVYFRDTYHSFSAKYDQKEYAALEKFLESRETLESYNLRQIREETFDPFNEMPPTLFSVFCSLPNPNARELVLMLYADGSGCVGTFSGEHKLLWNNFEQGIEKLQAYKESLINATGPLVDESATESEG